MVDIVRRGENIIKCDVCESVLRYSSTDIKTRQVTDWKSFRAEKVEVKLIDCPVCYEDVLLTRKDLALPVGTVTGPVIKNPPPQNKGHVCNYTCDPKRCDPEYYNRGQ